MSCSRVTWMARTRLSPQRLVQTKALNIGRIIIFCEGQTEACYYDYFSKILEKNKFTDIQVRIEPAKGNARTVLNYANSFLEKEENNRKFATYGKYLAFDCDDPPDIQGVIADSQAGRHHYVLLITNRLFEIWLLMHFENVDQPLGNKAIEDRLTVYLKRPYKKADPGCISCIIQNGDLEKAIDHAKTLADRYRKEGKSILKNVDAMNPYTNVYRLIEQLMVAISK